MKTKLLFLFISISIVFISCNKEGPMGPMGPSGQDGLNGADGASSKVYYFDVKLNQFIFQSYNNSWQSYNYIDGITLNDNDLVMAFVKLSSDGNGDNYWQALPYNEYIDTSDFYIQHSFGIMDIDDDSGNNDYLAGDIMFSMRTSTGEDPYTNMNSDALMLYNVYVIRGTQGKKAELPKSVNKTNRSEVEAYVKQLQIEQK